MAHPVILPRQGQSVESCIITQWFKKVGDPVKEGEVLFSYETDKASFEETAKAEGTLLAVLYVEDDDVPVLSTVAVIGNPGEDITGLVPADSAEIKTPPAAPEKETAAAEAAPGREAPAAPAVNAPANAAAAAGISPRARMTAQRLGIDPAAASPTGPQGRVIERDIYTLRDQAPEEPAVDKALPAAAAPAVSGEFTYTDSKLSNIRKVIAKTMQESLSSMAQLTHHSSFDATLLLALRARFKAAPADLNLSAITLNDLIFFAVSRTLMRHRDLNAHFLGDKIRHFDHAHLGMAVDTPRGLMVPTLFDADLKSIRQISQEAKELSVSVQAGSINPDLLSGGTFTVTNLGSLGIELFTPIINPPQVAILGVGCVIERVRTVNGALTAYPAMGLSLTYDHRAVDGAPASRFLRDLVTALEQIDILLLD